MKIEEAITILKTHNEWRRGADIPMTDTRILGEAIDTVIEHFYDSFFSAAESYERGFSQGKEVGEREPFTWHKVADGDMPKDRVFLAHCAGMGKGYVDRVVWDKKSGGYNNLNDIPPFESIKEYHFGDYYDLWIEIPEIQED